MTFDKTMELPVQATASSVLLRYTMMTADDVTVGQIGFIDVFVYV